MQSLIIPREKFTNFQNNSLLRVLINLINRANYTYNYKFHKSLNSLIIYSIENNIILKRGNLTPTAFINVIHSITGNGDFSEASQFLKNYINFTPESFREEVKVYSTATIQLYNEEFDEVSNTLSTINLRNSSLGFHFRLLIMKNALELAIRNKISAKEVLYQLDAIEKYIRRKAERNPKNSQLFLNFIKVARKLLRNIEHKDTLKTSGIRNLLKPEIPIAARQWLIQKIDFLEKNKS